MAKNKEKANIFIRIEKMPYTEAFYLSTENQHQTFTLLDFPEQRITDSGELCRDKPLRVRSNTGVEREIPWGTLVLPVKPQETEA